MRAVWRRSEEARTNLPTLPENQNPIAAKIMNEPTATPQPETTPAQETQIRLAAFKKVERALKDLSLADASLVLRASWVIRATLNPQ